MTGGNDGWDDGDNEFWNWMGAPLRWDMDTTESQVREERRSSALRDEGVALEIRPWLKINF